MVDLADLQDTPSSALNPDAKVFEPQGIAVKSGAGSPKAGRGRTNTDGSQSSRSRKRTGTNDGSEHTLFLKNLGGSLTVNELREFLEQRNVPAPADDGALNLHVDAAGAFRGTAFVRYPSGDDVQAALKALGVACEMNGRRIKVELQRKGRDSRAGLEQELSKEAVQLVQEMVTAFVSADLMEVHLPASFDTKMRKYAHSLAERQGLVHVTQASDGDSGKKCVYLSKMRPDGVSAPKPSPINKPADSAASSTYSASPISTFQPSPVLRGYPAPGEAMSPYGTPSKSMGWSMSPDAVSAWYAQLGGTEGGMNTPLNPNSPPFYPTPHAGDIAQDMAFLSLDAPMKNVPSMPDGTRGFRRQRTAGGGGDTPAGGSQSVMGALSSMKDDGDQ
jgi:RNA recognition motif-containing protein